MSVALRIALRELRGGLNSFWVYISCIALGVAAIAAAGSVTQVFTRGLDAQARTLLGGDAMLVASQRRMDSDERRFAESLGGVTEKISLNMMGAFDGDRRQVDVIGIDDAFPLIGEIGFSEIRGPPTNVLAQSDAVWGIAVSASFLDAFDAEIGDRVQLGTIEAEIRARLDTLPDEIGTVGTFGPEALIDIGALEQAGRLATGQLFRARLIIAFGPDISFEAARQDFREQFPETTLELRAPADSVDGLGTLLGLLNSFLSVVGIAALIAGGVGVEQATSSFLRARTGAIAALKSLGAESATIRSAYMIQLILLAVFGASIGLLVGAATPYLLVAIAGDAIALPKALGVYPLELLRALVLGVLIAGVFALPAVGRARATRPAALFRRLEEESGTRTPAFERALTALCVVAVVGIMLLTSQEPILTGALLGGAVGAWLVFLALAEGVAALARRLGPSTRGALRLTLANMGGPGTLTRIVLPGLGLGLALMSFVATVQANLLRQISETAPSNAPSLIFSQVPADAVERFDRLLAEQGVEITDPEIYRRAPFLLIRITELNGVPVADAEIADSERWVVEGETNVTYLREQPVEADLVSGAWWPEDYAGPLQVSVELDAARGLGLEVGDEIGVRVFGRPLTAEVASLRRVEWGSFSIGSNTALIFSPGVLEAANPYHVAIARTAPEQDRPIVSEIGADFPDVVVFETRPALQTAARLFGDIALAVNAAASVVTVSGGLVLLGAFMVMARRRAQEAALPKVFGSTRGDILRLYGGELAMTGLVGALAGTLIGVAGAFPVVISVFEADWTLPWGLIAMTLTGATLVCALGGYLVGRHVHDQPSLRVLRA